MSSRGRPVCRTVYVAAALELPVRTGPVREVCPSYGAGGTDILPKDLQAPQSGTLYAGHIRNGHSETAATDGPVTRRVRSCLRRVRGHRLLNGICATPPYGVSPSGDGAVRGNFCQSRVTGTVRGMGICTGAGWCQSSDPYPYGQGTTNAGVAISTNCMTGSGYTPKPTMNIIENTMTAMTPRGSPTRRSVSPSKYIFLMTQP